MINNTLAHVEMRSGAYFVSVIVFEPKTQKNILSNKPEDVP